MVREGSTPAATISTQRGDRSLHLRGNLRDLTVDDTVSGSLVHDMACRVARGHKAQGSAHGHGAAG